MPAQIISNGSLNSLHVEGVYIFESAPAPAAGAGIDTSLSGIVGTASFGPVNVPVPFSDSTQLFNGFGGSLTGANCLVTEAYFACANSDNFVGVRITDGTDVAAQIVGGIMDTAATPVVGIKIAAKWTGVEGNNISTFLSTGSQSTTSNPTLTATVVRKGYQPEVFANVANPTGSGAFWQNLASAINNGTSGRGPSQLVVATLPTTLSTSPGAASANGYALSGGTNGDGAVTTAMLTGGTTPGTGMLALDGTNVFQFILAGLVDLSAAPTVATFAAAQGAVALVAFPTGTTTATALNSKATNNASSVNLGLVKDFIYFYDPTIGQQRLVSPLGEVLGVIAALPPEASPGNKPYAGMSNILGTERNGQPYGLTEMGQLTDGGIMTITGMNRNAKLLGLAHGRNSSGIAGQDGINFTRMTNFLAKSFGNLLGQFVDELQSTNANDATRLAAGGTLKTFLAGLQNGNRISKYSVQIDLNNNSAATIGQGFLIANVMVQYMSTIRYFVVSFQGGSQIQINVVGNVA